MKSIYDKLDRIDEMPRARRWSFMAQTFLTTALGGALGFVLLFNRHSSSYAKWVVPTYIGAEALLLLLAAICFLAMRDVKAERVTSLTDIKDDVQGILDSFDETENQE